MNNPWLGLSSYTEESIKEYQFNGRSTAIAALTTLIRQNLFVTLYGRSGIGKSSLLQAGVYPILRREGYSPLTIRLNELKDGKDNAAKNIWESITISLFQNGYQYKLCDETDKCIPDFTDILVFRKLFSAGRFLNNNGDEAVPVIILDQFEEILYNAPQLSRLLISQLYALIDDNYNLGVSHPYWHDDTNFRIVISIREDDLFLFEDNIDSLNCADFKSNRYRLMPLSESEAKDVILNPVVDKQIFEDGNENAIATEIINLAKGSGQNVNTLLLSLICYVLYEDCAKQGKRITTSALAKYNDIIETYYKEVTKGLPKEQRYYIEDHLIDDQGRRTSIYLSDLKKNAPEAEAFIQSSSTRLLNETDGRVELIHDQLAAVIKSFRNQRFEGKRTRSIAVSLFSYYIIAAYFIWPILLNILRACWACKSPSSTIEYTLDIANMISVDMSIDNIRYMIYSQILSSLLLIYLISYELPKKVCDYFYSTLNARKLIGIISSIIISALLGTIWIFGLSVTSNSMTFPIIGWIALFVILILSNPKKT